MSAEARAGDGSGDLQVAMAVRSTAGTACGTPPVRHGDLKVAATVARIVLGWTLLLLAGCSSRSTPLDDGPLPFRQAEDNFRLGNYEKAVRGYQVFLDSESADDYEELVPRAYYRMALGEYRRGRYSECLAVLDRMERKLPDREWSQVYMLRGDAELARGNTISALRWWEQAYDAAGSGDERREARQHITDALDRMDPTTLTRARSVLNSPDVRALVDQRVKPAAGGGAPGAAAAPRAPAAPAVPSARSDSAPLGEPVGPGVANPRIAVLLPLSGEYATYGQRSLNGIKLALGVQENLLLLRDTKGDVAVARAAVDELAANPEVIAVIGPLRSKEAEAVAPRAERAGLPMVLLSQQEGVSGRWVIQPAMTAERQAAELAEYAVGTQGMRRFGILYPSGQYGSGLSNAFRQQVEKRGGQVVGSIVYDPNQREFSVELLSIDKWSKDDGLQAVFIPDFAPSAIPLATQVRHAHPDVALLGSNGWNDPGALAAAAADLDGAVFVDGFFASSQRRATQEFVAAYKNAFNATPEILEAQAFDAAALVARALQSGARSRVRMASTLQSPRTVEGAAGTLGIGPQGVERQLFLLRLSNGTISEIVATRSAPPPLAGSVPAR